MASEDRNYFERRAEAELRLAQDAAHPAAVRAHVEMAEAYLQRMSGETPLRPRSFTSH